MIRPGGELDDRDRRLAKLRRAFARPVPGDPAAAGSPEPRAAPPGLRAFLQRRAERLARAPARTVELPPGDDVENAAGRCWVRTLRYPLQHRHGRRALATVLGVDWQRIAELGKDDAFGDIGLDRCLFLDTETTGLMGGAGTTVFLTGLGWVVGDELVLEQVFLRSFADEPAAMLHVGERLRRRPLLVTFVGKTFDRHRLAARMSIHRVDAPILDPLHLDLYYLARRLWKQELPDVRLRTVEEQRLGLFRDDDLPGREAPYAFLSWVRDRTGAVDRVLEHNRLDVLSLVTLLAEVGAPVEE